MPTFDPAFGVLIGSQAYDWHLLQVPMPFLTLAAAVLLADQTWAPRLADKANQELRGHIVLRGVGQLASKSRYIIGS